MKELKKYTIWGIIFVSILGSLFHFVYSWSGNNTIVGLFAPINESTWEHMKLVFFPMLLYSFYLSYTFNIMYPCISSSMAFGTLLGTFLIPVLFYTYSGILGFNFALADILIFYISVIIAFLVAFKMTESCYVDKYGKLFNILIVLMICAFILFTICPPDIQIFISP